MKKIYKLETFEIKNTEADINKVKEYIKEQRELGWNCVDQSPMEGSCISDLLYFSLNFRIQDNK